MDEKKDTNFGKTFLDLVRKAYGEDFMFNQCTIAMHSEEHFTVRFDMFEKKEMIEGEMSNFDKLLSLEAIWNDNEFNELSKVP